MNALMFKVAAVQMTSTTDWQANLQQAASLVAQASEHNARLVVLPENFALYAGDYRSLAEQQGEHLRQWLCDQASMHNIWLVGGTVPLMDRPDGQPVPAPRVRAASLVASPQGQLHARYDKLHLFDAEIQDSQGRYAESAIFEPGDRLVCTALDNLQLGLAVCYDLRFPQQARLLADRGAHLLIYPSAFTAVTGEAHWQLLLRARAVETGCYVLGVNQCGQHDARRASHGHSMLVDPWGRVVDSLGETTGILTATLDFALLDTLRQRMPVHRHQRLLTGLPDDIRDT